MYSYPGMHVLISFDAGLAEVSIHPCVFVVPTLHQLVFYLHLLLWQLILIMFTKKNIIFLLNMYVLIRF
jgi:hypothetical protein